MCIRDRNKDIVRAAVQTNAFDDGEGAVKSPGTIVTVSYTHLDVYKRQGRPGVPPALNGIL